MLYGSVASELEPLNLVSSARFAGAGYFRPNLPVIKIISASFAGQGGFEAHAVFASGLFSLEAYLQGAGSLNISTQMLLAGQAAFAGVGSLAEQPQTIFSTTFSQSGSIAAGMSWRQVVSPLSAGGNLVRVTFRAGNGTYQLNNASIGIQSTTYNTTTTPVELLFGGASGFSLSANQAIVSDWAKLSFISSNKLVVIGDAGTGGPEGYKNTGVSFCVFYDLTSAATYNQASPAGSWDTQSAVLCSVEKIETLG